MAAYSDYNPAGPWTNGQFVERLADGVWFQYDATINALAIIPNIAGSSVPKDLNNNSTIINMPLPSLDGDAANKQYVDQKIAPVIVGARQIQGVYELLLAKVRELEKEIEALKAE